MLNAVFLILLTAKSFGHLEDVSWWTIPVPAAIEVFLRTIDEVLCKTKVDMIHHEKL